MTEQASFDMGAALAELREEREKVKRGTVHVELITHPSSAYCQGCAWWSDGVHLQRSAHDHTQQTGHEVRVEHDRETVYRLVQR